MKLLFIIVVLNFHVCFSQNSIGTISFGDAFKNGVGTLVFSFGYKPCKPVEVYVAPAWGMFTGGTSLFFGTKLRALSTRRVYPNVELAYRHSSKTIVSFDNQETDQAESYRLPKANYLVSGIGINLRCGKEDYKDENTAVNLTATYSYALKNYEYMCLEGPFSQRGLDASNARVKGGLGFTLSVITSIKLDPKWKRKKSKTG